MSSEAKWAVIFFGLMLLAPMVGLLVNGYQTHQCRIEAIKVNMDPEQINKVCK